MKEKEFKLPRKKNWAEKSFFFIMLIITFILIAPYFIPDGNKSIKTFWRKLQGCSQHACEYAAIHSLVGHIRNNSMWFKAYLVEGDVKILINKNEIPTSISSEQTIEIIVFRGKQEVYKIQHWKPISVSNLKFLYFPNIAPYVPSRSR